MDDELFKECNYYRSIFHKFNDFLNYWDNHDSCVVIMDVDERRKIELPKDLSEKLLKFLTKIKQDYYNKYQNFEIIKKENSNETDF